MISNGKITNSTNPSHFWRLDWLFPEVEIRGNSWAPTKRNYTFKRRYHELRFPWKIRDNLKGTSPKYGLTKRLFSGSGCFFYPWKSGLIFWGKWHCGGVPLDSHDIYLGAAEMKTMIGIGKKRLWFKSNCHPSSYNHAPVKNGCISMDLQYMGVS